MKGSALRSGPGVWTVLCSKSLGITLTFTSSKGSFVHALGHNFRGYVCGLNVEEAGY